MNVEKMREAAARRSQYESTELPAEFAAVAPEHITDLDVRDDLRRGAEPFRRIMQAQATVPTGGVLRVRAIFEPVPLYAVLGRQGFTHFTERLADDDWRVWFHRGAAEPVAAAALAAVSEEPADHDLVVLDVRGLEPPDPMTRTLEALEQLPPDKALLQINARVPQFLLPLLAERGFEYVLVGESAGEVRGLIRRKQTNPEHQREGAMEKTAPVRELDVRVIPPREKHPAIFQTFDRLEPGANFILVNDHDPFPLRYQFEAERTGAFTWDYVEKGPVVWRVRIGKVAG